MPYSLILHSLINPLPSVIRYDGTMPCDKPGGLLPLTASILSLSAHSVTLDRAFPEHGFPTPEIPFEYAIYALGGSLPAPVNLWGPRLDAQLQADPKAAGILGSKPNGMEWLQCAQGVIGKARSVLVVGGGALGIQLATDIADVHPKKRVTLVHSRGRFMPRFSQEMHDESEFSLISCGSRSLTVRSFDSHPPT